MALLTVPLLHRLARDGSLRNFVAAAEQLVPKRGGQRALAWR